MSDNEKDTEIQSLEYLLELARRKGVSTSSMRDGTMFTFTREFLQAMLDKDPNKDQFVIFVQNATDKPQN